VSYDFMGPDEQHYEAEMRRHARNAGVLWEALKAKLSAADYGLVRAWEDANSDQHLAELEMIQARLERRCPSLVDVIRESIIEGSVISYDDVTVTSDPALASRVAIRAETLADFEAAYRRLAAEAKAAGVVFEPAEAKAAGVVFEPAEAAIG
jgi:hypothetical protein